MDARLGLLVTTLRMISHVKVRINSRVLCKQKNFLFCNFILLHLQQTVQDVTFCGDTLGFFVSEPFRKFKELPHLNKFVQKYEAYVQTQ